MLHHRGKTERQQYRWNLLVDWFGDWSIYSLASFSIGLMVWLSSFSVHWQISLAIAWCVLLFPVCPADLLVCLLFSRGFACWFVHFFLPLKPPILQHSLPISEQEVAGKRTVSVSGNNDYCGKIHLFRPGSFTIFFALAIFFSSSHNIEPPLCIVACHIILSVLYRKGLKEWRLNGLEPWSSHKKLAKWPAVLGLPVLHSISLCSIQNIKN